MKKLYRKNKCRLIYDFSKFMRYEFQADLSQMSLILLKKKMIDEINKMEKK